MAATCLTMDARGNAPVGRKAIDAILDEGEKLYALAKEAFEPHEGVYRLSDCGKYVSAWDFESFWEKRPGWMEKAWMLADNGQYSPVAIGAMSPQEIEAAYDSPDFCPEFAFYTEAGEDGRI